jgi:ribosomal protein S2
MKIKKVKIKQLLKLNLLKSKVYEQPIKKMKFNNLIDANLNQIVVDIKKVLQIIFQYHKAEKRILFLGLPYKLESRVNQLTKHIAIPKNFNIQGVISNYNSKSFKSDRNSNQAWLKNSSKFLLPKLSKKLDLIVLFNHDNNETILSEAGVAKIPVIFFGTTFGSQNSASYKVEGNFKNVLIGSNKNIFFIGLNFLFKTFKKLSK